MPQNEKVIFPEGTGGFPGSWAVVEQTDQDTVAEVAIGRSKRISGDFMVRVMIAFSLEV